MMILRDISSNKTLRDEVTTPKSTANKRKLLSSSSRDENSGEKAIDVGQYSPRTILQSKTVAMYIYSEMYENSRGTVAAKLKYALMDNESLSSIDKAIRFTIACNLFRKYVSYEKPWDHKDYIREAYGHNSILKGKIISYDVWSNIHYGYVGRSVGFSETVLLAGAGYAQLWNSGGYDGWLLRALQQNPLSAMDDPRDQEAIKLGVKLFEEHGLKMSFEDFYKTLTINRQNL